jgi:hypothetical protein
MLFLLPVLVISAVGCREPLVWAPPVMDAGTRTIDVPSSGGVWYGLPTDQDCLIRMPAQPVSGEVKIAGCRDVKLVGGEWYSNADPCSDEANGRSESPALFLTSWSGVAHVEGVKVRGRGFSDGIWMTSTAPGSVSQVEGSWVGGLAACSEPTSAYVDGWPDEHPDCFQTWAGPNVMRFDKLTCRTIYEGLNLDSANWSGQDGVHYPAQLVDVRRTNVDLGERSPNGRHCFAVWSPYAPVPVRLDRARCDPGSRDYAGAFAPRLDTNSLWWGGVIHGTADQPDEIRPDEAGLGYRSPGYRQASR